MFYSAVYLSHLCTNKVLFIREYEYLSVLMPFAYHIRLTMNELRVFCYSVIRYETIRAVWFLVIFIFLVFKLLVFVEYFIVHEEKKESSSHISNTRIFIII